jgi:hypothetical protein
MKASTPTLQNQAMETQLSSNDPTPSPPQADSSERPSTACGSAASPSPPATYYPPAPSSTERPYTAHGTSNALPRAPFSSVPYLTSSARTSFTHVDIDSVPTVGAYPPLPNSNLASGQAVPDTTANNQIEANISLGVDGHAVQVPQTPQVFMTFLLVSGRRRTMSFDPAMTIGRVKELVWNAWPAG